MNTEALATFCEKQLQERLSHYNDSQVKEFTPSIKMGRRYIGLIIGEQQFMIEINVTEA
jgi:hypothetical protein